MSQTKYTPKYQSRFKKHYQNMIRANRYSEAEFKAVENVLLSGAHPDERYDDHVIKSRKPQRALFIKGSWLLIYEYQDHTVRFLDTGRHGEIWRQIHRFVLKLKAAIRWFGQSFPESSDGCFLGLN